MNQLRQHARSALQRAEETFPGVRPMLIKGSHVPALLAAIANLEADLVCVGSRGTSRPAGLLFGSVASAVAHFAPCSVLVARQRREGVFPGLIVHANDGVAGVSRRRPSGRSTGGTARLHPW